jgi:hypothetical protein
MQIKYAFKYYNKYSISQLVNQHPLKPVWKRRKDNTIKIHIVVNNMFELSLMTMVWKGHIFILGKLTINYLKLYTAMVI